jgi:hypothetical protein
MEKDKQTLDIQIQADIKDLEDDVNAGLYAYTDSVDYYMDRVERIGEKIKQSIQLI